MTFSRRISIAMGLSVLVFTIVESSQWWNASGCNDCALKYGFPFPFRQTEGYSTSPRFLWLGLVGDLAIAIAIAAAIAWAAPFIQTKKSKWPTTEFRIDSITNKAGT